MKSWGGGGVQCVGERVRKGGGVSAAVWEEGEGEGEGEGRKVGVARALSTRGQVAER